MEGRRLIERAVRYMGVEVCLVGLSVLDGGKKEGMRRGFFELGMGTSTCASSRMEMGRVRETCRRKSGDF